MGVGVGIEVEVGVRERADEGKLSAQVFHRMDTPGACGHALQRTAAKAD